MNEPDPSDQLRDRLARIDPATHLSPAEDKEILAMINDTTHAARPEPTAPAPRRRGPLMIGVGALAAGAVAATVAGLALTVPGDGGVTRLSDPPVGLATACAELTPETVAAADLAVRGTVVGVSGDEVTLEVEERYTGDSEDQIVLPQQEPGQPGELSIGELVEGSEYLIASLDGVVNSCGQSGPATPELEQLYAAAF